LSLKLLSHIYVHCFCFQLITPSCLNTFHLPLFSLLSFIYFQNLGEVLPKINKTPHKVLTCMLGNIIRKEWSTVVRNIYYGKFYLCFVLNFSCVNNWSCYVGTSAQFTLCLIERLLKHCCSKEWFFRFSSPLFHHSFCQYCK
jgi:hypothetical protein